MVILNSLVKDDSELVFFSTETGRFLRARTDFTVVSSGCCKATRSFIREFQVGGGAIVPGAFLGARSIVLFHVVHV